MKATTLLSKSLRERNRSLNELGMEVVLEMEEKFMFDMGRDQIQQDES